MHWATPGGLVAAVSACLLAMAVVLVNWRTAARARRWARLFGEGRSSGWIVGSARAVALALVVLAACRPQWGVDETAGRHIEPEFWLCLDVSRSMLARDASPNRLESAKQLLSDLLTRLEGNNVGLVSFAGEAHLVSPPSRDVAALQDLLMRLTTDSEPNGGSDLLAPLKVVAERRLQRVVGNGARAAHVVVVASDGGHEPLIREGNDGDAHAQLAVVTLGVGKANVAAPIPVSEGRMLIENGRTVTTRLHEESLRALAAQNGGVYMAIGSATDAATAAQRVLSVAMRRASEAGMRPAEQYIWFAGAAIIVYFLSAVIELDRRQQRPTIHLSAS